MGESSQLVRLAKSHRTLSKLVSTFATHRTPTSQFAPFFSITVLLAFQGA